MIKTGQLALVLTLAVLFLAGMAFAQTDLRNRLPGRHIQPKVDAERSCSR